MSRLLCRDCSNIKDGQDKCFNKNCPNCEIGDDDDEKEDIDVCNVCGAELDEEGLCSINCEGK